MSSMSAFNAVVNGLLLGPITQYVGGNIPTVIETCIFSMTGLTECSIIRLIIYRINIYVILCRCL